MALPHSEFLDQGHIRTVCTRVQFAAKACPPGSIYGQVIAKTPILDFPLTGNLYLRSSSHLLPDMVAVLKGPPSFPIEIESAGRIDSVHGGIRATFENVPDAPITEVVASFPGGSKGLLENSRNICSQKFRVVAKFEAHSGKAAELKPVLKASCKGKSARRLRHRHR